jgi:hypothetical protein
LAAGQPELLDGVHLPDGVRPVRPRPDPVRPAAGRGGRLAVPGEVALQGAGAGHAGEAGMEVAQANAQIGRAPGRVLGVQQEGLLEGRAEGGGPGAARVGGDQGGRAVAAEGLTEATHRARAQPELPGQVGGAVAALPAGVHPLSHGEGEGGRHGTSMCGRSNRAADHHTPPARADKLLSQLADKLPVA